jgi:hypothetical protein
MKRMKGASVPACRLRPSSQSQSMHKIAAENFRGNCGYKLLCHARILDYQDVQALRLRLTCPHCGKTHRLPIKTADLCEVA